VVADDGHRLIVDSEGNTRSGRQGKIIYHRDQQGNVRAKISANLPTKLHGVAQQLDQLASGSTVKSLGCQSSNNNSVAVNFFKRARRRKKRIPGWRLTRT